MLSLEVYDMWKHLLIFNGNNHWSHHSLKFIDYNVAMTFILIIIIIIIYMIYDFLQMQVIFVAGDCTVNFSVISI